MPFIVVTNGKRPDKPENASAIGFSDSLWSFVQRCWDRQVGSRPNIEEVVGHVGEAAANWNGLMPPRVQVEEVPSASQDETSETASSKGFRALAAAADSEAMSDPTGSGEFQNLILPWHRSSNDGIDGSPQRPPMLALNVPPAPKEYQWLWESVTNATSEAEAVRVLADIVVDKEGRAFALGLERRAAELCIETLDCVSCKPCFPPFVALDDLGRGSRSTTSVPGRRALSSSR